MQTIGSQEIDLGFMIGVGEGIGCEEIDLGLFIEEEWV